MIDERKSMNSHYRNQFNSLKQFVEALTDAEFEAVINYLVDTVDDFVDGDTDYPMGRYFDKSAAAACAEKFGLKDVEREADIDMLAFEFSMFM